MAVMGYHGVLLVERGRRGIKIPFSGEYGLELSIYLVYCSKGQGGSQSCLSHISVDFTLEGSLAMVQALLGRAIKVKGERRKEGGRVKSEHENLIRSILKHCMLAYLIAFKREKIKPMLLLFINVSLAA